MNSYKENYTENKRAERVEKFYKAFPITTVCRGDLEQAGFDTMDVDDDTMSELASKMADAYCDMGFWEDLKILAKDLKVKEHMNHRFNPLLGV
jgi:hypothetical protein